jgi:hypothetical protein
VYGKPVFWSRSYRIISCGGAPLAPQAIHRAAGGAGVKALSGRAKSGSRCDLPRPRSNRPVAPHRLGLVVGMRVFATPFDGRPLRMLAHPLRDIGWRCHGTLRERAVPGERQTRLFAGGGR